MAVSTTFNLFLLVALVNLSVPLVTVTSARHLNRDDAIIASHSNLATRLNLDQESANCWDSLLQLQACSGEVIMFFVNGQTYLGHGCCEAIRTIEHQCWPALLGTIGFTTRESAVLTGYCDESDHVQSPPFIDDPTKKAVGSSLEKFLP